ncbi:MAG: proline--tRNA ligase [Candidatus Omnitrophica bacterium]|nr:proline--tRNA ligase [Candidatus Omnitrophota bacterium]
MKWSNSFIQTQKENPSDTEAVSHRLMIRSGLIRQLASGTYSYLPLGLRALRKVETIIREEMNREGAAELLLPALQPAELWEATGRFEVLGEDMISFKDRHGKLNVLGPTHEEVITDLVRKEVKSYRQLPLMLYQIQTKFRDEARPRFGVVRSREFIMKDAYSFDADEKSLSESYEKMLGAYRRIFSRCGVTTLLVEADPGIMGGSRSHEFLVPTESGEEVVGYCESCQSTWPLGEETSAICPKCHNKGVTKRGLEIAHIFQLGTKYTEPLGATYLDHEGNRRPMLMGCYGIGVNRVVASIIEQHHDENGVIWPRSVAPFQILILPLVSEESCVRLSVEIYEEATRRGWEVLLDDRPERPGIKFKDGDLIGIPIQVVLGETFLKEGKIEMKRRDDGKTFTVSRTELFEKLDALLRTSNAESNTGIASQGTTATLLLTLREAISGILEEKQAELIEMTYRREGPQHVLRLLVDTPGGITLNECALLNQEIGQLLDERNLIEESYLLEVCSPGLDRPLVSERDFRRVIGQSVRLVLKKPFLGKTDFEGVLEEVVDGKIILRIAPQRKIELPLEALSRGKRIIEF